MSALDCEGRTIWIADAHRDDGKRFVVHGDEKLSAFMELESEIRGPADPLSRIADRRRTKALHDNGGPIRFSTKGEPDQIKRRDAL